MQKNRIVTTRGTTTALILTLLSSLACLPICFAGGLLSNSGFEADPIGETNVVLGWNTYGGNAYSETGPTSAHTGTNYFKVYQAFNGQVNYTGIYQDYISGPGAVYSADGWADTANTDTLAGQNAAWIEITFRDATANILALYRSALITTNSLASGTFPKNQWSNLPVTNQYDPATYQVTNTTTRLTAPPGTFFVRYQVIFQGDNYYSAGSVYFDDLNLNQTAGAPYGDLNIVWSDEFNSNSINNNVWTSDIGNGGWGNSELENYTSRTNNAFTSGGLLHIVARNEASGGSSYSSARLKSQGLFSCKYGRIEWRAQMPPGVGCWPALWLLGTNISSIGWPGCGEIDVMETKGSNPLQMQGSIHSGSDATAYYNFIEGASATNFHTYTLDWTTNAMLFYVDGHLYETQTGWTSSTTNAYPFPFNQPFFLIMNLAIGGSYLGNPSTNAINAGTVFPAEVLVDYVRIYAVTDPLKITIQPSGSNLRLSWPSNIVCHVQTQTNPLASGLGTNWIAVVTTTNQLQIVPSNHCAFYRLATP